MYHRELEYPLELLATTGNLLTLGASGFSVGADGAGFDVTLFGDRTGSDFLWDQDGQTNGSLNLGTVTVSEGVDLFVHGDTASNYLHWDCSADDLLLVGTATQLGVAGTTNSTDGTTGSIHTAGGLGVSLNTFLAGDLTVGVTAVGTNFAVYSDVALVGVFWVHDADTNSGAWSFGVTGGSKGTDVYFYGDTNGAYALWDSDADDLLLVGAGLYFSGTQTDEVIQIGGTYDHGIRFTEDMVAGDVTNSFINIGDYSTAIAVVPAGANMFGVMHNVTMAVDVAYWYQAYYTKITTSGTTDTTSIAGHAYRLTVGSDLAAVYGIQSHINISGARTFTSEVTPGSFMLNVGST